MNILQIRNLRCEYVKGVPVLRLQHLDLPSGKLVFIIGRSGIGKSTLIETLGLMNRTIAADAATQVLFHPPGANEGHDLSRFWEKSNATLAEFRRKHFSFVFQNTNLMPNFSSGENMMISLLIKGKSMADAKKEVLQVMDRLSLPPEVFDKRTTEISGGQRQRLAFVRAITADYSILFGDEPTGNLDKNTSEELMSILREQTRDKGKTGIIVSHDLYLAEKFADIVAPITPEWDADGRPSGDILPKNIITRADNGQWLDHDGQPLQNAAAYLNSFLQMTLH